MEKVKVTAEQAKAIDFIHRNGDELTWVLQLHAIKAKGWMHSYSGLNEMDFGDLAKALYIGYEIEQPKFQPGDKVIVTWVEGDPTLHEVQKVENDRVYINTKPPHVYNPNPPKRIVRHATPEEIYWLETLNRKEIAEFKNGDVLVDRNDEVYILGGLHELNDAKEWYEDRDFKGIYPAESFKPFPKEETK